MVEIAALVGSAIVAVGAAVRSAGGQNPGFILLAWLVGPYLVYYAASVLARHTFPASFARHWSARVAAILFLYTCVAYLVHFGRLASTDALKFIFTPLVLYFLPPVVLAAVLLVKAKSAGA